jgi:hypothetical protein
MADENEQDHHRFRLIGPEVARAKGVDEKTLKELHDSGTLREEHVSATQLESMLKGVKKGAFKIWTRSGFDQANPPKRNAGISICYDCGEMYWVTPLHDAYVVSGAEGKVCNSCMSIESTVRSRERYEGNGE